MKSEWCDFWFKIKEEEGRKEVYSLGKKSTERRFDWKVSMYRWTSALRIEICDVNIFPVSGFEPLTSRYDILYILTTHVQYLNQSLWPRFCSKDFSMFFDWSGGRERKSMKHFRIDQN